MENGEFLLQRLRRELPSPFLLIQKDSFQFTTVHWVIHIGPSNVRTIPSALSSFIVYDTFGVLRKNRTLDAVNGNREEFLRETRYENENGGRKEEFVAKDERTRTCMSGIQERGHRTHLSILCSSLSFLVFLRILSFFLSILTPF